MSERCAAKGRRQQHLYLAFDDWDSGYTIRKVCLSLSSGEGEGEGTEQPLAPGSSGEGNGGANQQPPSGVFMRICAPRGAANFFTSAFGTKILVLHHGASDVTGVPIIDVEDWRLRFGPELNYLACLIYFPVGDDRLFALDIGKFNLCLWTPEKRHGTWGWTPERRGTWVWQELTYPPFQRHEVSSYAVRPDGCILISTKSSGAAAAGTTFIFDTKEYVWRLYGHWAFLFTGRGYYDPSLEAFVGMSKDPNTLGYLYCCYLNSCTVASTASTNSDTGSGLHPSPDWKCSKETVYNKNSGERHVSATLVHMRRGKFCLVECVYIDDIRADQEVIRESGADQELRKPGAAEGVSQRGGFTYGLKTFSIRYDANGDLKLKHCRVRCYSPPHETTIGFISQDPAAFWM
ncbi:unnamed protein product [Urochloa decumbens]|uniref:F-box associated domain-containing protein n=1 Tax=Urochloa decumbens TaxID=240449 RepID=A0ABC9GYE3_9POAL